MLYSVPESLNLLQLKKKSLCLLAVLHSDLLRLFLPEAVIYFRSALRRNGRHALILHSLSACLWCCSPATLTSVSACVIHQSIFGLTHFSASSVLDACTLSAVSSELIRPLDSSERKLLMNLQPGVKERKQTMLCTIHCFKRNHAVAKDLVSVSG